MTALKNPLMTADEFYIWAEGQEQNFELFDGVPVAMSPERAGHRRAIHRIANALERTIAEHRVPCEMLQDGPVVRIDARNSYQPDVLVYSGDRIADDALVVPNPVIVVEVLSPNNAKTDISDKLTGYIRVPSIQHYLVVDIDKRFVIHDRRSGGDTFETSISRDGDIVLDPPGLTLAISSIFPPAG